MNAYGNALASSASIDSKVWSSGRVDTSPFGEIEAPLEATNRLLDDHLASASPRMHEVLRHLAAMRGKRLRPALTLLSATACGGWNEQSSTLAASVELVHMATLVHDDVLDHATLRRHLPTVHSHWDTTTAILVGDWLFTRAYRLANAFESTVPGRWLADAACGVCEGEMEQNAHCHQWSLSEPAYLQMLKGKTGELCAVSCRLGAWSAQADDATIQGMAAFGMNLGIAFQIYDDWLDFFGDPATTGKSLHADLRAGKPTLPVIHFLQSLSSQDRAVWLTKLAHLSPEDSQTLVACLTKQGAVDSTLAMAQQYVEAAKLALQVLPSSTAKLALERLAHSAIHRQA